MAGQSISDRLTAAKHSLAGQGLAKSVCKATTEEVIGPKKKHLDYLLHCTNEPNVSIPQLANLLIERTNQASWVIVFKALITVHHLMCYGNERFTQYLASSNCHFQLSGFLDKTGYDMSTFIRRYAKYLNEKALSYRTVAFDFCKVKRGKEDGVLRTMNAEKLLKVIPILQNQLDALLEFDCTANELTNGVVNMTFMLLFRDLIRLFACYNDGIINLLEKYFDMNKKMCRDALDIYKKFLIRMDRVAEFLKVAENVGIEKGDIPDLTKAPSSLLDALEQHLASIEGKKGGGATTPTQSAGRQSSVKNAVLALSSTSNAFGSAAAASAGPRQGEVNGIGSEDGVTKLALEEEQVALNQHKERRLKELGLQSPTSGSLSANTNPFLSSPSPMNNTDGVVDLFGAPTSAAPASTGKASDDLLCLSNNPFTDNGVSQPIAPAFNANFWGPQNGFTTSPAAPTNFVPETTFTAVFGSGGSTQTSLGVSKPPIGAPGFDAFGDILQPTPSLATQAPNSGGQGKQQNKIITGDLDSSLASLVQNLDMQRGAPTIQKGSHAWNSPKNMSKTGGANWAPIAGSTAAPGNWGSPQHGGGFQPMGNPPARPAMGTGMMSTNAAGSNNSNAMGMAWQSNVNPAFTSAKPTIPVQQSQPAVNLDPFGNL